MHIDPIPNRMYYAEDDTYGSPTSWGFVNSKYVLAFGNKAERDAYVEDSLNLTCRVIDSKRAYELMPVFSGLRQFILIMDGVRYDVVEEYLATSVLYSRYVTAVERVRPEDDYAF